MPTIRPYFKSTIKDLESIFEAGHTDKILCQSLIDELGHRSTDRSSALLKRVHAAMVRPSSPDSRQQPLSQPLSPPHIESIAPVRPQSHVVPKVTNAPASVLAAWTAIEALSPQTYRQPADLANGESRNVAPLRAGTLPWTRQESSRKNYQLYYQVVLGSVPLDRATEELTKAFGADEELNRREKDKAALAMIMLDRNGLLLKENAVAVSSFGWALPVALTGNLRGLSAWITAEKDLVEGLTRQLVRTNEEGEPLPLDIHDLTRGYDWLVKALKLPAGLHEAPTFALRVYHYFKQKSPPEVTLLNSFFLADLGRASKLLEGGKVEPALARYIGLARVQKSDNVLENRGLIEQLIAPTQMPLARWPSPGGHPLVTLQQAAVNASRSELAQTPGGVVAVNGPPGTGKTTLLRDIVASCVLDRAIAMARFDDPSSAFGTTGEKMAAGDRAFLHLYRLDKSLKGHEILVASSNNKAVENVSKELPALKASGRDFRYFRTVSDRLLSKRSDDGTLSAGEPTWGLAAAVLGNAANRAAFQQAIWWDDDRSLRLYLKKAKGDDVVREIKDDAGKVLRREIPTIVQEEQPPSPEQAKSNWQKARKAFTSLLEEVRKEIAALESARAACLQLRPARSAATVSLNALNTAQTNKAAHDATVSTALAAKFAADAALLAAQKQRQDLFLQRPGWLHRLFNTRRNRQWRATYTPLVLAEKHRENLAFMAASAHSSTAQDLQIAIKALQAAQENARAAQAKLIAIENVVAQHRKTLGNRLVDDVFFQQGHEQWNLAAPWIPDDLHKKREDLFAASLNLHRAFIDVNAQKISHNMGVLMSAMQSGAFKEESKRALLGDLWSTLFVVCPVVSTTFASVDRMLGDLPPSSLGWALIDEAGQATPQAAVGTLMRAKRAIIVGDPLQIPPVVSLPQKLIIEVAKYFGASPTDWLAPEASAQTLADQASRWRAEFKADIAVRDVGIPLLVHRRCKEPMFGISNRIAYDGQMVHAVANSAPGIVAQILGVSRWIDIDGTAESKWCPEEGEEVIRLLSSLAAGGAQSPDIYVITPFRVVAQELRRRIEAEPQLLENLGVADKAEWLFNRVGTIHTFQGKEAEAVIAVLGAPMSSQMGARKWATSTPNILNVMVSRAKQALYVVGSRAAWSTVGHGASLAAALPLN